MNSKLVLAGIFLTLSISSLAGPLEEAELDDIALRQELLNTKKDWAQYRLEKRQHECYQKFFTSPCLDQAKADYKKEIKEIRLQEKPMHERERQLKAIIKDERDLQRAEDRLDPEAARKREENVRKYEQKQVDEQQRQKDVEQRREKAKK